MLVVTQLLSLLLLLALAQGQGHHRRARAAEDAEAVDWNMVTDRIIEQFKEQILEQNKDEVEIPDVHESLERKFGWVFKGTVSFEAKGGHLSSIASIHRIADVIMSQSGNNMTFTALLKFANLKIHYDHYAARVKGIGPSGSISARVMDNSVLIRFRIDVNSKGCSLMHEDVEELTLSGLKLKVTGLGPLNWLASKIATCLAKSLQHDVKDGLQHLLDRQLAHILRNTDLDCTS